jgi:site-specific recombinase XerC
MSSVFKRARDRKRPGSSWYVAYVDDKGVRRTIRGCPDKAATEAMARKLETEADLRRRGVIDPRSDAYAAHEARPLAEHVREFSEYLIAKGGTEAHATVSRHRIARVAALILGARPETVAPPPAGLTRKDRARLDEAVAGRLQAARVSDLSPSRVQCALGALRNHGLSLETVNHHVRAIKAFSRWLWKDGRAREHTLAHLSTSNPEADRRLKRRALTRDEAARLVRATQSGPVVKGMSAEDRAMAYRVALSTGFRADEMRSLLPEAFRLETNPPQVVCEAGYTKNGHKAEQPIPCALAALLQPWLASRAPGRPLFKLRRPAEMLRVDLEAAGIPFETASGVVDFHGLRATYVSHLVASGASVKTCQVLARHSTPSLTIGVYAKASLHDITGAVEALPDLTSTAPQPEGDVLAATGTDGGCALTALGQRGGDGSGRNPSATVASDTPPAPPGEERNSLELTGFVASGRNLTGMGRGGIEPPTPGFSVLCSTS